MHILGNYIVTDGCIKNRMLLTDPHRPHDISIMLTADNLSLIKLGDKPFIDSLMPTYRAEYEGKLVQINFSDYPNLDADDICTLLNYFNRLSSARIPEHILNYSLDDILSSADEISALGF